MPPNQQGQVASVEAPVGDVDAAIGAGIDCAKIDDRITEVDGVPIALVPDGMEIRTLEDALDLADARALGPRRRKGTANHQMVESFIDHVNRFKDEHSAIFADVAGTKLTAVLDYHEKGPIKGAAPRWGEHRSIYACPLSRQWKLWNAAANREMSQEAFGDFIDANLDDLASADPKAPIDVTFPAPAEVLKMARTLSIQSVGEFKREINPTTGEGALIFKDEHGPTSTKIPRAFLLKLPVFEGGELYQVEARLRFSLNGGRPKFVFFLHQADVILRDAFDGVRVKVLEGTKLPVFVGSPE
jgi:uncharacterized protein YfdQ (DUF2303 family)